MARAVRTGGRVAAAAWAGLEDQKLAPLDNYQFTRRLVFGPAALNSTPHSERTQLAACELQDVCHDAMTLGSSFAEDPAIQAAVIAKLRKSPELQAVMSNYGIESEMLAVAEIQNQAKELQSELEFQQDLNQDMITHAERLAEERVALKARVLTLEQENDRLRTALERTQNAAASVSAQGAGGVAANEPLQAARRPQRLRAREARSENAQRSANAHLEGPTGAQIVMQMALAFAAVVVALVVAKKMPTGLKASAVLAAALNAFGAFRS